ncbi:hypothetical protein B0H19DRAFT_1181051 [Mycena capillaripes]|nr:hypothetical protein B0H19DRAFT_1181051 [Mycena capillaripes]
MSPAGILDLPTEILVNIFECPTFPPESLYYLALLSRRLHFITLPIYFSRSGVAIDLEAKSASITLHTDNEWDILSVLQICLFISSLEHLACTFSRRSYRGSSQPNMRPFLRQVKRLELFVSRLSSVKIVTINLASGQDRWSITQLASSRVGDLLNCIVQRGCDSLTVVDSSHFDQEPPPGFLYRMFRLLVPRGQGSIPVSMPSFPARASHLTSISIDSATLLVPPGCDWLVDALQRAPITNLTLAMPRGSTHTWRTLLPGIAAAVPALTVLVLTHLRLSVEPAMLDFLSRLPHLTALDISDLYPYLHSSYDRSTYRAPAGRPPALRRLTMLRAPAHLVAYFLSRADALLSVRGPPQLYLHLLLPILSTIVTRLAGLRRQQPPQLMLTINARLGLAAASVPFGADTVESPEIATARARVEGMHLDLAIGAVDSQGVARLVALFPKTAQVSLTTAGPLTDGASMQLVETIQATEVLTAVELNGKRHALEVGDVNI